MQQALTQSLAYINKGYCDIVDIDLSKFFDEVAHYKILQLIHEKVKCETTIASNTQMAACANPHKWRLLKRRKGLPQGSPLSPLLSNIMLDQWINTYRKEDVSLSAMQTILVSIQDRNQRQNLLVMKSMFF